MTSLMYSKDKSTGLVDREEMETGRQPKAMWELDCQGEGEDQGQVKLVTNAPGI